MKIEALISVLQQHTQLVMDATSTHRHFNVVGVELVDHGSHAFAYVEIKAPSVSEWSTASPICAELEQIADTHPGIDVMTYDSDEAPYGGGEYNITRAVKNGRYVTLELESERIGL